MSSLMFFPPLSLIGFLGAKVFMAITIKGAAVFSFSSSQCGFTVWVGTSCICSLCVCVIDILTQPFKKQFRLNMLYLIFANVLLNIFDSDYFSRGLRCKWTSIEFWTFLLFFHKKPSYASFNVKTRCWQEEKKKTSFVTFMWLVQTLTRTESSVMPKHETPTRFLQWEDIETLGLLP